MEDEDSHVERSTNQARQAVAVGPMRYVLGFGIAGVVVAFLIAWLVVGF
jgi:hypothetical protein